LKLIFAGTPEFAASHLAALLESNHEVVAVYTQPDRPACRGNKLKPSAVKVLAQQHNIPVYQPETLKSEQAQQDLIKINADLMIVVAYGLLLPKAVLDAPKLGCINVHGSILPKWRGAAPIQRSIWAGDKKTGVTIMQMDEGLDTGDILAIETINIDDSDTSASLYEKLAELGPIALVNSVNQFSELNPIPQDNAEATYAAKLSKQEAYLDWQLSAKQLVLNIRAFYPWPVAWFSLNEKPIKVFKAHTETIGDSQALSKVPGEVVFYNREGLGIATSNGILVIDELQLAGKKSQAVSQLVNGQPSLFTPGQILQ